MNTKLYDKRGIGFTQFASSAAKSVFGPDQVAEIAQTAPDRVILLRNAALAVGHLSEQDFEAIIAPPPGNLKVLIRFSSQGPSGMSSYKAPYRLAGSGTWVLHLIEPEPSSSLTIERWTMIFKAIEEWDSDSVVLSPILVDIFEPNPEIRLALQLLCEAYKLEPSGAGTKAYLPKAGETQEVISVRCPEPKEWFSIFGTPFPQKPNTGSDAEQKRFESELDVFANRMGDARDQAKELARAIATDDPRTKKLILSFPDLGDKEQQTAAQRDAQ